MGSELHHWQHPYVNIAKVWRLEDLDSAKKSKRGIKKGDVKLETAADIRSACWRIGGAVSSQNCIQFPDRGSLKLTGRYCYLAFRPKGGKYFVAHFDVAADEGMSTIRLSFSNMYKAAKLQASSAQFPFLVSPSPKSVDGLSGHKNSTKGVHGAAPASARWTMLIVDLKASLAIYFKARFRHLKGITICSSCHVKGVYTSATEYDPSVTIAESRAAGCKSSTENLGIRRFLLVLSVGKFKQKFPH